MYNFTICRILWTKLWLTVNNKILIFYKNVPASYYPIFGLTAFLLKKNNN